MEIDKEADSSVMGGAATEGHLRLSAADVSEDTISRTPCP